MIERIIFGCHNLTGGSSYGRSRRLVEAALGLGIRRFDVAPSYGLGTAETVLARALGSRRQTVEITTKFGILPTPLGWAAAWVREPYRTLRRLLAKEQTAGAMVPLPERAPASHRPHEFPFSATTAVLQSLRRLGVDHVDALLIHERIEGQFALGLCDELAELKRRGIIGRWGVSGARDNVRDMIARTGDPEIVQVAIADADAYASAPELRLFNLGRLEPETEAFGQGTQAQLAAEVATALAARARRELILRRNASILFNTGSISHLELFVKALGH
ncbi:MAG: aldo/keto reductase [Alphaproteobacteria bacterium]|nr:aldo/keto reductase [Alphaproteobacteria bacterium]